MISEKQKEEFLMSLIREYYCQGDSYYVQRTKKGNWEFGYSNDYPLQHGSGENFIMKDQMLEIIMNTTQAIEKALK